ncbi:MAG: pilin [Candidatus Gracilibacteria bacterium]|nr:pilin [Candidatus Gracilibacteria bacterium]
MKKFLQVFLLVAVSMFTPISVSLFVPQVFAETNFNVNSTRDSDRNSTNLDRDAQSKAGGTSRVDTTDSFITSVENDSGFGFGNTFKYFRAGATGERGTYNLLMNIARDLKNVVMLIAIVYLVISVLRMLLSGGSDEDVKKWKTSIIWTSIGIVVMQSAFIFVKTLFDKNIDFRTAQNFSDKIIFPFTHLLEILASFAFLAMAFFAFYKIVTAGGDEERAKAGKQTIIYAIVGFLLIKLPGIFIKSIYGEAKCEDAGLGLFSTCSIKDPKISETITIFTTIINYVNSFLALVIIILILYAGFLVLTSGGDDEKMKKAKGIIKYIIIGVLLLVTSYILFSTFLASGVSPTAP